MLANLLVPIPGEDKRLNAQFSGKLKAIGRPHYRDSRGRAVDQSV